MIGDPVDHAAEARKLLDGHKETLEQMQAALGANPRIASEIPAGLRMAESLLTGAQVHATLAVAEQLRAAVDVLAEVRDSIHEHTADGRRARLAQGGF